MEHERRPHREIGDGLGLYDFHSVTGTTHKAVGRTEIAVDARRAGLDALAVISTGNYRDALCQALREVKYGVPVVNLVSTPTGEERAGSIELVMEPGLIYRDAAEREAYVRERLPRFRNVRDYTDFIPRELEDHARRIMELPYDVVAVPVGSGKLFTCLYRACPGSKTLVGFTPFGENGVRCEGRLWERDGHLHFTGYSPRSRATKLSAPWTAFRDDILRAEGEGHRLYEANEGELSLAHERSRQHCIASRSGAAGFALLGHARKILGVSPPMRILIVSTGSGKEES